MTKRTMFFLLAIMTIPLLAVCDPAAPTRDIGGEWEGYGGAGPPGSIYTIERGGEGQIHGHDESGRIWGQYLYIPESPFMTSASAIAHSRVNYQATAPR